MFEEEEMTSKSEKPRRGSRYERHRVARVMAVQAVYEALHHDKSFEEVRDTFLAYNFKNHTHPFQPDRSLFLHLMSAVETHHEMIQVKIDQANQDGWHAQNMDPTLKAILSVAFAELIQPLSNIPKPVTITEYVEITRAFFEDKEAGYVNKVLDTLI